ncbi:uncharacterized protein LOC133329899 [Musca vetustissima]|uniref:uncharacterized protein LOC133329899 n=1 Tax=Musca vetustissima TaxID=27455 RepID=UPI002AB716F6|nr:uncharacterized protein LOC133329899 [Musca vetustissima]
MPSTNPQSHKLNEFGFIDYQQPLNKQQDMRTSTYFGNKYMTDTMLGNTIDCKFKETPSYKEDVTLAMHRQSDYKTNYTWKFGDPNEVRNPTIAKLDGIKPFYECKMKFLQRPMVPTASVSHTDYLWNTEPIKEPPISLHLPTPVIATKISIDRAKPGYSKYLDTAATTSRLDYCHRSPQDIMSGIAAKDNITFWNWQEMENRTKKVFPDKDPQQCDKLKSNECVKRRCEFPSLVKAVPNTGMTTEVRDNYIEPYRNTIEYDTTNIHNDITHTLIDPFANKSEYNILGSGECTHKYV